MFSVLPRAVVSRRVQPLCCRQKSQSVLPRKASRGFAASTASFAQKSIFERTWSTPLAEKLARAISVTGPIPLASYMRMCLTSDLGGYYTGALGHARDQFGAEGDFVTSPEISQVFGELIGIWFVAQWISQGRPPRGVELIELGPGRGTLMDDMLRTLRRLGTMAQSIDAVYMVEASPQLRIVQKNLLCGEDAPMTESNVGYHSVCKHLEIPVIWTETVRSIPYDASKTPFILAHEFFDALPIHAFVNALSPALERSPSSAIAASTDRPGAKTKPEWREVLVSPSPPGLIEDGTNTSMGAGGETPPPDFQMTLSPAPTRHSQYLPDSSPRLRVLRDIPGALIEVCPDAALYASDMALRIGGSAQHPKPRPSGAGLILDYGPGDGTVPVNSLRGIRRHRRVSPFVEPGLTDLSVDVDFAAIAEAATQASEGIEVYGPVEQGAFLETMGIRQRVEALMKTSAGPAKSEDIQRAWKRLVDRGPAGMGRIYKALAIVPESNGSRRPVGFGGDLIYRSDQF